MATVQAPVEQQLVLSGVDWETYTQMLRALERHPGVKLTYDRGSLEIMTLSHLHESSAHLLGRLVVALTEELGLPIKGGKSTTFRRRKRRKGLEPDECYWIASEPNVRGKDRINLRVDPPPDLALEIDITHSSLDRMSIYAALRVPELWRFDSQTLTFLSLGTSSSYGPIASSLAFPGLTAPDLAPFLALRGQMDENGIVRQFRLWVRQHLLAGGSSPPAP